MAELLVRNLPDELVAALERRAAGAGRSIEAEHRLILEEALRPVPSKAVMLTALQGLAWDDPDFRPTP